MSYNERFLSSVLQQNKSAQMKARYKKLITEVIF